MSYLNNASASDTFLMKPFLTGGLAAAGSAYLFGTNVLMPVPILGSVPLYAVHGVAAYFGSMASEFAHKFILPHIGVNQKFKSMEAIALGPTVNTGVIYMSNSLLNPRATQQQGLRNIAMLGVGSELLSQWVLENFFT